MPSLDFLTPNDINTAKVLGGGQFQILGGRYVLNNSWAINWFRGGVFRRTIQNCGTNAIKYWLVPPILVNDTNFDVANGSASITALIASAPHGILAPGTANDDGFGALVDLSGFGQAVYIAGVGAAPRALIFEAYTQEGLSFQPQGVYKTLTLGV